METAYAWFLQLEIHVLLRDAEATVAVLEHLQWKGPKDAQARTREQLIACLHDVLPAHLSFQMKSGTDAYCEYVRLLV